MDIIELMSSEDRKSVFLEEFVVTIGRYVSFRV